MTFKMIGFLLILIIIAVFSAFNLKNTSNIELGFRTFKDVPIFLSLLIAYIAGSLTMIPFTFRKRPKAKKKEATPVKEKKRKKKFKKDMPIPEEKENIIIPDESIEKK